VAPLGCFDYGRDACQAAATLCRKLNSVQTESSGRPHLTVVIESEFTALGRSEERTSSLFVRVRHNYFDRPESIERQPVSVSQRFAAQGARNARRFQECPDLLRVNLTVRDEYNSLMLIIHGALLCIGQNSRWAVRPG
jgi:hypothetical protein